MLHISSTFFLKQWKALNITDLCFPKYIMRENKQCHYFYSANAREQTQFRSKVSFEKGEEGVQGERKGGQNQAARQKSSSDSEP